MKEAILHLRHLHPGWGPATLRIAPKADERLRDRPLPSRARIATLLKHTGLTRRYQPHHDLIQPPRVPLTSPHQEWQMDAQPHESDEVHKARQFASFTTELQKLRLVWEMKPFSIRKELVNLFVEKAVIHIVAPHWIALEIIWSYPAWGNDTIYLWRNHGAQYNWTEEELALMRQHPKTRDMETILQALPTKIWKAIKRKNRDMGMPT